MSESIVKGSLIEQEDTVLQENHNIRNLEKSIDAENLEVQENKQIIANTQQESAYTSLNQQLSILKCENSEDQTQVNKSVRKESLMEADFNADDIEHGHDDVRRKINQKLYKNRNFFMDFVGKQNRDDDRQNDQVFQQEPLNIIDKRSRSETPNKMSSNHILFRAKQKLQERRKESPSKLMEKHQLRQKKAEELRAQIEQSRKTWYQKIKQRQQVVRERWQEIVGQRNAKLQTFQSKLVQAEERRESEIQSLKNKAKQEIQKIDETNYIMKLTMNNMKLDIDNKMSETQERRNQILEEYKQKQQERHMKEEAVIKRKQELMQATENKRMNNQQKREQADMRRIKMLEIKRNAAEERTKRELVLKRKLILGDKISDVMSFINNSENIWEFLGNEFDLEDLGLTENDEYLFQLLSQDHFELEKLKLKRDAELLNHLIIYGEDGNIYARKELLPYALKKLRRADNCNSSSSDDEDQNEEIKQSPKSFNISPQTKLKEEQKKEIFQKDHGDLLSDGGTSDDVAEECKQSEISDGNQDSSNISQQIIGDIQEQKQPHQTVNFSQLITDEELLYRLYSIRLKMSTKRNVLKKSRSEDMTWTDFLKDESFLYNQQQNQSNHKRQSFISNYTRSMHSTPERKTNKDDIPSESEMHNSLEVAQVNVASGNRSSNSNSKQNLNSQGKGSSNQTNANNSSYSNISEKSRISSTVYPSQNKKIPNNIKSNIPNLSMANNDQGRNSAAFKRVLTGSSNQNSTQSLIGVGVSYAMSLSFVNTDIPKDSINQSKKIATIEGVDQDSNKKNSSARMHSSSVTESTAGFQLLGNSVPANSNNQQQNIMGIGGTGEENVQSEQGQNNPNIHTGIQMSSLITNARPIPPPTKIIQKKLTANAIKMLFPIREKKLLFKRPGKEGQFGKCRISIKVDEHQIQKSILNNTFTAAQSIQLSITNPNQSVIIQDSQNQDGILKQTSVVGNSFINEQSLIPSVSSSRKSLQSTPTFQNRKQSTDTNNSSSNNQTQTLTHQISLNLTNANNLQNQFELQQVSTPTQSSRLSAQHQKLQQAILGNTIPTPTSSNVNNNELSILSDKVKTKKQQSNSNLASENSPSPDKKQKSQNKNDDSSFFLNQNTSLNSIEIPIGLMNEQGYKELIIKYLMTDHILTIRADDTQKTLALENPEADKLIDFLESHEMVFKYCRICDLIIPDHSSMEAHFLLKSHKKTREELGIKDSEDHQNSIISFMSYPGDITQELQREKELAIKRKVKRLKAQMIQLAVTHESASYNPGKDFISANKKRFQILCMDLEKQVIPIIKDYESLEITLKEIIKILDMRKSADLHLMRKLKFVHILIEICKRLSHCHKNEIKHLARMIEYAIKIINIFCGQKENRNYMFQTNRLSALIDLLNWCLNRPTQLFYGITFLPQLFNILTLHVKHRVPYECQQMKEMFVEYLICSQITMKIKSKFQIINGPLDLSERMGQVPMFLLQSCSFIESLTTLISLDARNRPVYEKSTKLSEQILFTIQNTELFGIIPMITTILLTRNQPFKPSASSSQTQNIVKVLPKTFLSLAIISIKTINNVFRIDYRFAQQLVGDFEIQEQLYHLFNFLLVYTVETSDQNEDCKELLHETLLMIGYFCLSNEKNQQLMCKGENTLLQKLCNLPFPYFCDKKLKEILFPTLIAASYKNERSLAIMDQEISIELLVDFIQITLKEELPRIVEEEFDYQSMSSVGKGVPGDRKTNRSPSISSTNSSSCSVQMEMLTGNSPYLPLYMRFPKKLMKDAITFYSKVLF